MSTPPRKIEEILPWLRAKKSLGDQEEEGTDSLKQTFDQLYRTELILNSEGIPRSLAEINSKHDELMKGLFEKLRKKIPDLDEGQLSLRAKERGNSEIVTTFKTFIGATEDSDFETLFQEKVALNPYLFAEYYEVFIVCWNQMFGRSGIGAIFPFNALSWIEHRSVSDYISLRGMRSLFEKLALRMNVLSAESLPKPSKYFQVDRFPYWSALQETIDRENGLFFNADCLHWLTKTAIETLVAEEILKAVRKDSGWDGKTGSTDEILAFYKSLQKCFKPVEGYLDDAANALAFQYSGAGLRPSLEILGRGFAPSFWKEELNRCAESIQADATLANFDNFLQGGSESFFLGSNNLDTLSGPEFEGLLKDLFTSLGFAVEQTGQTGDQGADLILKGNGQEIVIQAKRYTGSVGNAAVQQIIAAREFYRCQHAIVITTSHFTASAKALAQKSGVELWDRDILDLKLGTKKAA